MQGRRLVVLATGDPLWFSVGARIARALEPGAITFHPQLSAFQLAAARMGWSLADVETLTVHGRPGGADDPVHPAGPAAADPDDRRRTRRPRSPDS